ncbi:MAG TPA: hypothetical protein PKY59_15350 [Pyrinomonadaceae bacterium]|nr:hypothetical protein [Pyrinomonadaceae bacterium]
MTLKINDEEKEFLLHLLSSEHKSLLDELHHTESYDYKQMLKQKDEFLRLLKSKVESTVTDGNVIS